MQTGNGTNAAGRESHGCRLWGVGICAGLALLVAGCHTSAEREAAFTRVLTPQVPVFLNGPAAVLLTNTTGFSAHAELQTVALLEKERLQTGQLLGAGSKLLYVPEPGQNAEKPAQEAGFSFIWDVATGTGYVLCEPLQAYAPISSTAQVTNMMWEPSSALSPKLAGHLCAVLVARMRLSNGSGAAFEVCRAPDLQNLPLRVSALTNANPFTLSLTKPRVEAVRPELFAPPDGFTRYSSAEAMADELAARRRILRHGNRGALEQEFERSTTPEPKSR